MISIKRTLYQCCQEYLAGRLSNFEQSIKETQEAANEETKSSAGDKYETGRAMMQIEIENNLLQVAEIKKLKSQLDQIDPDKTYEKAVVGSIVNTDHGNFFISISAGTFSVNDAVYITVSPASPIGQKMLGLCTGDSFQFNKRKLTITDCF